MEKEVKPRSHAAGSRTAPVFRGRGLVLFGSVCGLGVLIFMTALIAIAALSPGGAIVLPLARNDAETAAAIAMAVLSLVLFPDLWRAIDLALARHYCRCHFLGTSWRARRAAMAFGAGCILTAPVVILGAYLLAALCPSGVAVFNVNAFGEAIPELTMFTGLGLPAAVYSCANAVAVQGSRWALFRRLFDNPRAGTDREWHLAAKSLFKRSEWMRIAKDFSVAVRGRRNGRYKANVSTFENQDRNNSSQK